MLLTANGSNGHPFRQGTESNHSESDHLTTGGNPLLMQVKRMVGYEVSLNFKALLDHFGFLPFLWVFGILPYVASVRSAEKCLFVHPIMGREKGEHVVQSNVFLWTFWLSHYRLNQWFFCLSALKTRSGCMGENATIYDVLHAYVTKHCKYRIFCQDGQEAGIWHKKTW